jgi:hypothetical protein
MSISHFELFLLDATVPDETHGPLGPNCLYGLYTSWCTLHKITPVTDVVFRAAMERRGIDLRQAPPDGGTGRNRLHPGKLPRKGLSAAK